MKGSYSLYIKFRYFLKKVLDGLSVLAADIEIIPSGLACPIIFFLAIETTHGQGSELAEGIGTEESAAFLLVRNHHLRPVNHRCGKKLQAAAVQIKNISLFKSKGSAAEVHAREELSQHLQGFGRCCYYKTRIKFQHL